MDLPMSFSNVGPGPLRFPKRSRPLGFPKEPGPLGFPKGPGPLGFPKGPGGKLTVKKHVFVTKWVEKARNPKILIPIDAARPGDLENLCFCQKIPKQIMRKSRFSCLGSCAGVI